MELLIAALEHSSWPVATIVVVILLRKDFGRLVATISQIKHKDTEINFNEQVEQISGAENTEADGVSRSKTVLAKQSPRGAVLDSWLRIEESMNDYAKRHDSEHIPSSTFNSLTFYLMKENIGKGTADMLDKLHGLKNRAVHLKDEDIDSETAIEFEKLANRVISKIEEA